MAPHHTTPVDAFFALLLPSLFAVACTLGCSIDNTVSDIELEVR